MTSILSIEAFIPSGPDFPAAKNFFQDLGFTIKWDAGDYVGFQRDGCSFILQNYNHKEFAENLMLNVKVSNAQAFREEVVSKQLPSKYGVRVGNLTQQPYGKEVNIIDQAGVCWHFVE